MGLGKIARGLGKVGLLIEGVVYVVAAGKALVATIERGRSKEQAGDAAQGGEDQQAEQQAIDQR